MATAPICIAVQFRRANLVPTASASASCPLILICNKTTNSASSPGREGEGEWFKGQALMLLLVLDSRFTFLSSRAKSKDLQVFLCWALGVQRSMFSLPRLPRAHARAHARFHDSQCCHPERSRRISNYFFVFLFLIASPCRRCRLLDPRCPAA